MTTSSDGKSHPDAVKLMRTRLASAGSTPQVMRICGASVKDISIAWCQFNANQSPKFAREQALGNEKVAPFAKRGVPADFEV